METQETQRRSISWSLALIAAISLTLAGIWGAQVASVALRHLVLFNLARFAADLSITIALAGIALVAGTCAIFLDPPRASVVQRTIVRRRQQRSGVLRELPLEPVPHRHERHDILPRSTVELLGKNRISQEGLPARYAPSATSTPATRTTTSVPSRLA